MQDTCCHGFQFVAKFSRTRMKKKINYNLNVSYRNAYKVSVLKRLQDILLILFLFSLFESFDESFQTFALSW